MATKHQVIELHRKHPEWTGPQIAEKLGCISAYVRATAARNGLKLPNAGTTGMTPDVGKRIRKERELGRAAMAAGLTLNKIRQLSA